MKWLTQKHHGAIYTTIRRALILLVIATIIGTTAIAYRVNVNGAIDSARKQDVQILEIHQATLHKMRELAYKIGHQAYLDTQIAVLLYGKNPTPQEEYEALIQLNNYRTSIPNIESIYVYNGKNETVAVSSPHSGMVGVPLNEKPGEKAFFDQDIKKMINQNSPKELQTPFPRMIRYADEYKKDAYCYTFVVSTIYGSEKLMNGIFVNFSVGWLAQIAKETKGSQSETMIIDENGVVVFGTKGSSIFQNIKGTDFFEKVKENAPNQNSFFYNAEGKRHLVNLLSQDESGWYYLRTTPNEVILSASNQMIRIMITTDILLLIIFILASLVVSKRIYIPIDSMSKNLVDAQSKKEELEHSARQKRLLRKLLLDTTDAPQYELLIKDVSQVDPALAEEAVYYVLILRIDKYNRFCTLYQPVERAELMERLIYQTSLRFKSLFHIRNLELGEGCNIVFVLSQSKKTLIEKGEWISCIDLLRKEIKKELNIKFSCAVSEAGTQLDTISRLYYQAGEALKYRIFHGFESTFFGEDLQGISEQKYIYPINMEEKMISAIITGNQQEAQETAHKILLGTKGYSFTAVNLAISSLTMALLAVIDDIEQNNYMVYPPQVREALYAAAALDEVDCFETTLVQFDKVIQLLVGAILNRRDSKQDEMAGLIDKMIMNHYTNPDCNLNFIAQEMNMSSAYIARSYRNIRLRSIPDVINALRMKRARELLLEKRTLSIGEVAYESGFSSSSYFSKAFRKEHGMSPNEYRNYAGKKE